MSTIKTDRIEPLGTTIVVSSGITVGGGAHFSGGVTAAGGLSVTGSGITVGGGAHFSGGITAAGGISAGSNSHFGGNVWVTGGLTADSFVSVGSARMSAPTGSAPLFGIRAWGSFRGSTTSPYPVTGVCGGNISTITKLATTGEYGVTFDVAMPHNNYAVVFGGSNANDGSGLATVGTDSPWNVGNRTVTGFKIRTSDTGGTIFNLGQNGRIHEIFFMVLA